MHFVKWSRYNGYDRIISWSDNTWTEGGIYKILGFKMEKEYPPDYFYWNVKEKRYESKQSKRKRKINCPEGMTEREWCFKNGLFRIYDCGKRKWAYMLA